MIHTLDNENGSGDVDSTLARWPSLWNLARYFVLLRWHNYEGHFVRSFIFSRELNSNRQFL